MTVQGPFETMTVAAGGDLSTLQFRPIRANGIIATSSSNAVGILQNKPTALGQGATLAISGVIKSFAGAAVSVGDPVGVATNGYLVGTNSGTQVGKALETVNSGDLFRFQADFATAV